MPIHDRGRSMSEKSQEIQELSQLIWVLAQENAELKKQNKKIIKESLNAIIKTLEAKDRYTHGHSHRVAHYALLIAKKLSFTEEQLIEIELAALLHDIGKISTPDNILNKPGKLTPEEFEVIKEHPVQSYEILSEVTHLKQIALWVRAHQERIDGFGYPDGLRGENIPLPARIITVADAFDAMTSDRPYRAALSIQYAYDELKRCSGTQFDSRIVDIFIQEHQQWQKSEERKTGTG